MNIIDAACFDAVMEKHFRVLKGLGFTEAACKEKFYGFEAVEVVRVHFSKQGRGAGVFFRLRDGRVIDTAAQEHNPDPIWYDQTTH